MRMTILAVITTLAVGGGAYGASDFVDTAQVISSKPIIERVTESRQECDPAPTPQKSSSNIVAPILGGVIGGLLGNQVGQGNGRTVATIVGATGGAVAGSVIGSHGESKPEKQQCRTIETSREVVSGYDVVYRYNGHDISAKLPHNPGANLKVAISAQIDDRSADSSRPEVNLAPPYRYQEPSAQGNGEGRPSRRGRSQQQ